jgi:hypothetical protein
LLDGIGEFAVAIGEFDACDVQLDAFGDEWVVGFGARESGHFDGVIHEERRLIHAQFGFDEGQEYLKEEIIPGVIFLDGELECAACICEVIFATTGCEGKLCGFLHGPKDSDALPGEGKVEIDPLIMQFSVGPQGEAHLFGEVHQQVIICVCGIPFEACEFGVVHGRYFAVAKELADLECAWVPCGDELFHGKLGAGSEKEWDLCLRGRKWRVIRREKGVKMGRRVGAWDDGGCFDFEKVALVKEVADGAQKIVACTE